MIKRACTSKDFLLHKHCAAKNVKNFHASESSNFRYEVGVAIPGFRLVLDILGSRDWWFGILGLEKLFRFMYIHVYSLYMYMKGINLFTRECYLHLISNPSFYMMVNEILSIVIHCAAKNVAKLAIFRLRTATFFAAQCNVHGYGGVIRLQWFYLHAHC